MPLILALALAFGNTVEFDGERWLVLQDPEVKPEEPPAPQVLFRDVRIQPETEEVRFVSTWRLTSADRKWFEARLTGPGVQIASASYKGRDIAITEREDGVSVAIELQGTGLLVVRGVKAGDASRESVALDLMPAAVGRVQVDTEQKPVITARGPVVPLGDGIWTGAAGLAVRLTDPAPPAPRPDLAMATSAVGLTVGEGAYDGQGRLRWELRHGEFSAVSFDARGIGSDLDVKGPAVASWDRSGDRVTVKLLEPEDRLVELNLTWTGTVPTGDEASLALPQLKPLGAFKTESSVMLAKDGEIEVVPQMDGWTATSFSDLPEWGRGLVTQTASATLTASGSPGGSLRLFRFTPVTAPPTFVDVATITAAMTADGNVLMRAHYAVRNDRSAHLRVTPPEGARVVGARVVGETARVSMDDRTWLIPLEKSVETVEGLLSFPVEVVLLLPGSAWERKEARALPIPRVDAPVAVTRATIYLPPGYSSALEDGDGDVVGSWSDGEGLVYGEGTGDSAQVEAVMQEAVQAWMANDFDNAETLLRDLEELGGFDENARRLQSNLDVISGKGEGQYDVAMERRVKEQAKARSDKDKAKQEVALKEAESSYLSGDYAAAESQYRAALEIGEKLDKLEQKESVELEVENVMLQTRLAEVEKKKVAKAQKTREVAAAASKNAPSPVVVASPAPAPSPKPPPPPADPQSGFFGAKDRVVVTNDQIVITESTGTSEVLTEEFLNRVPAGRSYQSAVGNAAGVTGAATAAAEADRKRGEEEARRLDEKQAAFKYEAERAARAAAAAAAAQASRGNRNISGGASNENTYVLDGPVEYEQNTVIDFESVTIEGELVKPQGQLLLDRRTTGGVGVGGVGLGGGGDGTQSIAFGGEEVPEPEPEFDEFDGDYWEDELVSLDVVERRRPGIRVPNIKIGKPKKGKLGVPGGVEGGVVGGVVGGVMGGQVASGEYDFEFADEDGLAFDEPSEPEMPEEEEDFRTKDPKKPAVTAVQLTAVIPSQGEVVRYEHLLLEADATYTLPIEAKSRRRDP